ncbi:CinA family protein [Mycoplasmoides genitalium]|uniref:Protein MG115 n=1 Tax=Mycoplasma genitalium (strain ATCC 33530 / DSM 19775 / NCTC 10195 / G37) TaxID=243273 RepID=Y115_MYCGE|nr:nicotinamide-nucleotide amidohydrolase family protein [Mycoplasmoides genitalium]P47361.2 RecName: Full=Protein MG115 [Mycoplasmoides genitalium G37]ABY79354.1 competence/damage-inducible protein CinA domain protein [synthetic Mycoplasma genitalium JCVI-1.0]AAC71333.1 competence/damage-inducible protein CinA domain protein [Mycoplasmoides genitalium G37]AFQ02932.1 competence/damage inducible protein CinA [Mycoplasmoides genitalium M2321]AFQ03420.1 competence/damage inducible protein CinA [M
MFANLIAEKLQKLQLSVATAESVTGGLLAHCLTSIDGASNYFNGGVIAYNNQVKINLLNVQSSTIANHGAVSSFCAREMAVGVKQKFQADVGIACSGIAGSKAVENKAIGLLFFCIIIGNKAYDFEFEMNQNNRKDNIELFTNKILESFHYLLTKLA